MKYIYKYSDYIKEGIIKKSIEWILNKIFASYLNKKVQQANPELYEVSIRINDPRMSMPEMIAADDTKLYEYVIKMYDKFYPNNNLLSDCEFMLKHFQNELWKFKGEANEILSDAIFNLDKFIKYVKDYQGNSASWLPVVK